MSSKVELNRKERKVLVNKSQANMAYGMKFFI